VRNPPNQLTIIIVCRPHHHLQTNGIHEHTQFVSIHDDLPLLLCHAAGNAIGMPRGQFMLTAHKLFVHQNVYLAQIVFKNENFDLNTFAKIKAPNMK
jgi:hypothetical protein